MKESDESGLKNKEYNKATNAFFYASLAQIPLFAVPAILALLIGKYLDSYFETGKSITIGLLFLSFISSWILVLKKNAEITKEYKKVREQMKASKNNDLN